MHNLDWTLEVKLVVLILIDLATNFPMKTYNYVWHHNCNKVSTKMLTWKSSNGMLIVLLGKRYAWDQYILHRGCFIQIVQLAFTQTQTKCCSLHNFLSVGFASSSALFYDCNHLFKWTVWEFRPPPLDD